MFSYYLRLAVKSLRRNPVINTLMVLALALGIGTCMTTFTVYYLMSGNPIPHKSDVLHAIQLDSWDPLDEPTESARDVNTLLTHIDATALMNADTPAKQQVAMYFISIIATPADESLPPFATQARATYGSFFSMFDTPFLYGSGWSRAEDDKKAAVAVITREFNERIFGGENSVGRDLILDNRNYRVIGVLDEWRPTPRFYDLNGQFSETGSIFIPMTHAVELQKDANGRTNCWKPREGNDYQSFLNSECVWIQFWAELSSKKQAEDYLEYLNQYTENQKSLGRFQRPTNNFVTPVMEWLDNNEVVGEDNRVLVQLSFLFLLVCIINTIGLLLAKFMGKASEVALRRAMGASRSAIFSQNLIEVSIVGVIGGVIGIAFAYLGLMGIGKIYRGYDHLVQIDFNILILAIALALISSILAGMLPVLRVSKLAPASYLKIQ